MCFSFRFQQILSRLPLSQIQPRTAVRRLRQVLSVPMLALGTAVLSSTAPASPVVTLSWNANPETDIAGYRIYLGAASGNLARIGDVGNATSHLLTALEPSTTYFCALQAYNTDGIASQLSAEVSFTTQTAAALLTTWATGGGLSGSGADPAAMPFNDGVPNLLKYAFNLSAAGPDGRVLAKNTGTAGLPVFTVAHSGAQAALTLEFLRRKGCGLDYVPEISSDLVTYLPMTGTATVTGIDDEWERVVIQQPPNPAGAAQLFGRVEVTLP